MVGLILPILLGCSLAIYATPLNPGLPIFLIGTLGLYVSYLQWKNPSGRRGSGPLFLLGAWSLLSTFWSIDPYLSQRRAGTILGMLIIVCFLQSRVPISENKVWRGHLFSLLAFLLGSSALAWLLSISSWVLVDRFPPLTATFPNQDSFSYLPMLGLFLSLALLRKKEKTGHWLAAVFIAFFLPSLLVTGCRSALLGLLLGLIFGILALGRQRKRAFRRAGPLLSPLLWSSLLIAPFLFLYAPLTQKFSSLLKPSSWSKESIRWDITTQGWKAFSESPILGHGAGTFGLAYQAYRPQELLDHYSSLLFIQNAHNDPLDLLVELGLPGLLLWGFFMTTILSLSLRRMRHSKRPLLGFATGSAVVASLVFSLFNFVLVERIAAWAFAWTIGLLLCLPSSHPESSASEGQRKLGATFLLLSSLWLLWFGSCSVLAEKALAQGRAAENELRLLEAERAYRKAVTLQPQRVLTRLSLIRVLRTQAFYTGDPTLLKETEAEFLTAHHTSPKNLEVLLEFGEFELRRQKQGASQNWIEAARKLAPYSGSLAALEFRVATLSNDPLEALTKLTAGPHDRLQYYRKWVTKLLWELEGQQASTGILVLQELQLPSDQTLEFLEALQKLEPRNEKLRQRTLEARLELAPKDLCLQVEVTERLGKAERERALRALLLSEHFRESGEVCRALLLREWAPLVSGEHDWNELAKVLQPLLEQTPHSLSLRQLTAEALENSNKSRAAVKVLREGLALEPYSAPLLFTLAQTFERSGSLDLARAYYSDTLQVDPTHRGAQNGLERLR